MKKQKNSLSVAEVKHVAHLANLELTDQEILKFQKQLSSVVDFIGKLDELDIKEVNPTSQVTGIENVFREDVVQKSLSQNEVLANAPSKYKGYFKVKAIFDEE